MGKASERAQSFIKEVGSGKLAQDLKSKYANATKSQFSIRITKKTNKLLTAKNSLKLSKLKNLKNLNKDELSESLNNWFQDKSISSDDESDSNTEVSNGKAEKPTAKQIINDSTFLKQTKGWINCFKRADRTHHPSSVEPKQKPSSCSVEDYSNEIDLSTKSVNSKTTDLSISISNESDQQQSKGILSKNLLKNVDNFYAWCEQQMDISTQDLITLKKLRNNAKKKLEASNNNN